MTVWPKPWPLGTAAPASEITPEKDASGETALVLGVIANGSKRATATRTTTSSEAGAGIASSTTSSVVSSESRGRRALTTRRFLTAAGSR
jgi:hypothetical protein